MAYKTKEGIILKGQSKISRILLKMVTVLFLVIIFGVMSDTYEAYAASDTIYNGTDYSAVYDKDYYYRNNPDVKNVFGYNSKLLLQHFVQAGMREGRQAKDTFDVHYYKSKYPDLRNAYGNDYQKYFYHFMANGAKERRIGYSYTKYQGVEYSLVYNKDFYLSKYPDLQRAIGNNPIELLKHFVNAGMYEGRQGNATFNMQYYKSAYIDLKRAYGNNNKAYYMHYIRAGKGEGRRGCSENTYNGVDYSLVYDKNYYYNKYPDLQKALGYNADALLEHFVLAGMYEGRQAKETFNVQFYKWKYLDLYRAYKDNIRAYYLHYIGAGYREGRQTYSYAFYNRRDYSLVYDKDYYYKKNIDLQKTIGNNPDALIKHFVQTGMYEGRQAKASFDVKKYMISHPELEKMYGKNYKNYYFHYMEIGYKLGYTGGQVLNGWNTKGSDKYYYINGKACTGWNTINNRKYYFNDSGILKSKTGIDVSKYQGKIDWQKVKNDGIEFAIIRIGYGDNLTNQDDPTAIYNMQECERLGIPYGVYIYSYALTEAQVDSEVAHVLRMIKGFNPEFGVFYDVEDGSISASLTKNQINAFAYRFLNKIRTAGYNAGLYANKYWLTNYLTSSNLQQFIIWIANYNLGDKESPAYSKPYKIWQYSSKGIVDGISGNADMNVYLID